MVKYKVNLNKQIYFILIQIKNSARMRKMFCDIYISINIKYICDLLNIFYEKGFINTYIFITKNKIRIFLNYYKRQSIFQNLKIYHKIYTYRDIHSLYNDKKVLSSVHFYLFKTIYGYCFLEDLYLQKIKQNNYLLFCKF